METKTKIYILKKIIFLSVLLFVGFFFFNTSHAQAATLYFNAAADTNWNTLGNWWNDAAFTIPAAGLPGVNDDAILTQAVNANSGGAISVHTITVNTGSLGVSVTVSAGVTFNGTSQINVNKTITGNATFNDSSLNKGGTVTGNAVFNNNSSNSQNVQIIFHGSIVTPGVVSGTATFNNSSFNIGTLNGVATFNNTTYNNGTASTNATFNNSSYNQGTVGGNATFNNWTYNSGTVSGNATFTHAVNGVLSLIGSAIWGTVVGTVKDGNAVTLTQLIFNDTSSNTGSFTGTGTFYDTSNNAGTIAGNACFASTATNSATVTGTVTVCPTLLPSVSTQTPTPTTSTTETLNGDILSTGGAHPTVRGFAYGTDPTLTTVINTTVDTVGQPFAAGSFTANISNLFCNNNYYARAYATNSINTAYGSIVPFVTAACPLGSGGLPLNTVSSQGSPVNNPIPPTSLYPTPPIIPSIQPPATPPPVAPVKQPTTPPPVTTKCLITNTLKIGSKGNQVKCLQMGLNIFSDGNFGPKTKTAVILFQKSKNLTPDGIFGPKSRAVFDK